MYRRERGGLTRAHDLCMWQTATLPGGHWWSWMMGPYGVSVKGAGGVEAWKKQRHLYIV